MPKIAELLPNEGENSDLMEYVLTDEELQNQNDILRDKSANAIMAWSFAQFNDLVKLDTSCGRDSAVGWHMANSLGLSNIDVAFGDTGFWPPETHQQKVALVERYPNLTLYESRPTDEVIADIKARQLWLPDEHGLVASDLFLDLVKHKPMTEQDLRLGKVAAISAIHNDQTSYRQGLRDPIVRTKKGGYRIFPFLHWTQKDFDSYLDKYELPRNECPALDLPDPRTGRRVQHRQLVYVAEADRIDLLPIEECGLHTVDGKSLAT